jgi:WD40 repeat protein
MGQLVCRYGGACSESGKIFSASYDKCVCVYDSERPKEQYVKYENMHAGAICQLDLDPENNWIITGSYDGSVKIWSHEVGRCTLNQVDP